MEKNRTRCQKVRGYKEKFSVYFTSNVKEVQTIEKRDKKVIFKNLRFVERIFRIRRNEKKRKYFVFSNIKIDNGGL